MTIEHLLYGLEKDETREYMETLLLVTTDKEDIDKVKKLASAEGWHSFREATYNSEAPNFTSTLNI